LLEANFAELERRILTTNALRPDKVEMFKRLVSENHLMEYHEVRDNGIKVIIIDDFYQGAPGQLPLLRDVEFGHIDRFRFISSPLVQEPEEPRAKNGAAANRKTQQAKAKLPFYHKNRRF
jgi:hypothetical protein